MHKHKHTPAHSNFLLRSSNKNAVRCIQFTHMHACTRTHTHTDVLNAHQIEPFITRSGIKINPIAATTKLRIRPDRSPSPPQPQHLVHSSNLPTNSGLSRHVHRTPAKDYTQNKAPGPGHTHNTARLI